MIAVVGPTASGKTRRAVELARHFDGEVVSCDSRQVYVGMDLGTGKDLDEYGDVPCHLIDVRPAGYKYNLHEYLRDYEAMEADLVSRGKEVVLCGGTGMYAEAVLSGVRLPSVPENVDLRRELEGKSLGELREILEGMKTLHNVTDVDTVKRAVRAIEIQTYYRDNPDVAREADRSAASRRDALIVGVEIGREERRERISRRLRERLEHGMVEEVAGLLRNGVPAEDLMYYGLEYKFVTQYVVGQLTREEMVGGLETAIHQFAKRQMTWFRGMERRGFKIHWLPYDMPSAEFVAAVECLRGE